MPPIRLAFAEDHPALRDRLAQRLAFFPDEVEVVLAAETGEVMVEALAGVDADAAPEVVLMDVEMPGQGGIWATRQLKASHPATAVLMLTVFDDPATIRAAVEAGASGYLLKEASAEEIVAAVREAHRGGVPLATPAAQAVLSIVREAAPEPAAFGLTTRELEVLTLLVDDLSEEAIAEQLYISPHTVRSHVKNVYRKLSVGSRTQAVREALRHRLVG
jgi:DNA-binding NarL/FixJ family response regulator